MSDDPTRSTCEHPAEEHSLRYGCTVREGGVWCPCGSGFGLDCGPTS